VSPCFLIFSLSITQHKQVSPSLIALLMALPVVTLLLVFTNSFHHLIWTGYTKALPESANLYIYHHGLGFWTYLAFNYACLVGAFIQFLSAYLNAAHIQRRQYGAILVSSVFPFLGGLLYASDLLPLPGFNLTAFSFAFTSVILVYAFYSYSLLDIVPVARTMLVDFLEDGILVYDQDGRILDMNSAAQDILELQASCVSQNLRICLREKPGFLNALLERDVTAPSEVELSAEPPVFMDVRVTPIQDIRARTVAHIAILRDITLQRQARADLLEKTRQMEQQAITDELTGIYNRRHVQNYLAHHRQIQVSPLTIALFDIDNFKSVNDRYGHQVGDEVLKKVARAIQKSVRSADIPARMGGDEFLILFPHTATAQGYAVLERVRKSFLLPMKDKKKLQISVSGGITEWKPGEDTDETLTRADRLLYRAKENGKNCILFDGGIPMHAAACPPQGTEGKPRHPGDCPLANDSHLKRFVALPATPPLYCGITSTLRRFFLCRASKNKNDSRKSIVQLKNIRASGRDISLPSWG